MPLIIISGVPASGKTRAAAALRDFFIKKDKEAVVISEGANWWKAKFNCFKKIEMLFTYVCSTYRYLSGTGIDKIINIVKK